MSASLAVIYVVNSIFLVTWTVRWYLTWRISRGAITKLAWKTLLLTCKAGRLFLLASGCILLMAAPLCWIAGAESGLGFLCLANCIICFSIISVPPVVLYLSNSNPSSLALFSKIIEKVAPLRACAALEPLVQEAPVDQRFDVLENSLRTPWDDKWRETISHLADLAAVVVLDLRVWSPAVSEEYALVRHHPKRVRRVLFRADERDCGLILLGGGVLPRQIFTSDEDLLADLQYILSRAGERQPQTSIT